MSNLIVALYSNCLIVKERLIFQFLGEDYAEEELDKRKKLLDKAFFVRTFSIEKMEKILQDFNMVCGTTYWYGEQALYCMKLATDFADPYLMDHKNILLFWQDPLEK